MKRLFLSLMVACSVGRVSATTITVTNLADFDPGSLYQAVFQANTSPPPVVIQFNYTGTPPFIIRYTNSFLPYLTNEVSIDGASQPGYTGSTPVVWLDGSGNTNASIFGILVQGGNSTIRALRVHGFANTGIILSDKDGDSVVGCWIVSNQQGITVNTSSNLIGGTTASNRNIISGNTYSGIRVSGPSSGNKILGNYIGLNPTNTAQGMTNGEHGVYIVDGADMLIAGTSTARQVISANNQYGIYITGSGASNNVVVGNHIGVGVDGATAVSNGQNGVYVAFAGANRIGGTNASDANVISGNGSRGLYVWASSGTVIQGNKIGTSSNGLSAVQNSASGVTISDAPYTLIGGSGAGAGNVISGNRLDGIQLFGSTGPVTIQGNAVGLSAGGSIISNGGNGIYVSGSPGTLIGGSNINERNSVGGNGFEGIYLGFCSNVTVQGNLVGLDFLGFRRPNGLNGILLSAATDCRIGGTNSGARNVVSANKSSGIFIDNGSARNVVEGNYVGVNSAGAAAISNEYHGVRIRDATNNLVGGSVAGAGNVISGNDEDQVHIEGASVSNVIAGNFIGVAANGTTPLPGAVSQAGIVVSARDTVIGGTSAGERNVIAGNSASYGGILVAGSTNTTIQGNYIGLASNGVTLLTNGSHGISLSSCLQTTVGGTAPGAGNVIASDYYCVYFSGADSNSILGNIMGLTASGTTAITNVQYAIWVQDGAYNTIGGTNEGAGNAIFSKVLGITLFTTNTHHNVIQGNLFNLSPAGNIVSSNCGNGISVSESPSNTIGGASDGARNLIAANGNGIQLAGTNTTGNSIRGNYIGVALDGVSSRALTNVAGTGVQIQYAPANMIGGTNAGEGNIIAFRTSGGISVFGTNASGNGIFGNVLYSNRLGGGSAPGIDLNGDNVVQANDNVPDADNGANRLQNYPVITNATTLIGSTRVQGYLPSAFSQAFRLEFFASDVNFQEGRLYLGATNITTAASGTGVFTAVLNGYAATSRWITATATDSSNNTSEFSTPFKPSLATDTDGDKMPDFWESQYGLNPNASNAVTADVDGDGVPDIEEYIAATIPNSATSYLALLDFDPGTNAVATVSTSPFRTYNLESSTNLLLATAWRIAVTNALGSGLSEELVDPAPITNGAYRVRVVVP